MRRRRISFCLLLACAALALEHCDTEPSAPPNPGKTIQRQRVRMDNIEKDRAEQLDVIDGKQETPVQESESEP